MRQPAPAWTEWETAYLLERMKTTTAHQIAKNGELPGRSQNAIYGRLRVIGYELRTPTPLALDAAMEHKPGGRREKESWSYFPKPTLSMTCLCCREEFFSWSKSANRLCDQCGGRSEERLYN